MVAGPFPDIALRQGVANDDEVVVNYMRESDDAVAVYREGAWATWGVVPAAAPGLDNGGVVQAIALSDVGPVFAVTVEADALDYSLYFWRDGDAAPSLVQHLVSNFFWPEYAVMGSDLYLTAERGDLSCIDRLDLTSASPLATAKQMSCGVAGSLLFSPSLDEGTLVFGERPASDECTTELRRVDLASGAETVVDSGPCAFMGLGSAAFSAWTQVPPDRSAPNAWNAAPLWADVGGDVTQVGETVANSPIACGGALYFVGGGSAESRLKRWEPGGEAVTVYRAPPGASVLDLSCAAGRLSAFIGDADGTSLLTTPPPDWSAGVPSDAS
ncbi:MAG TPA: hypothetical protein VF362_00200 [Demequinaceae bacterium]